MNQKKAKKIRQMFSRQVEQEAKKRVSALQRMVRPKPKLIPIWLWKKIIYYILNIK